MWTPASTTDLLTTAYLDIGVIIAFVLATIVTGGVALLGLGFGWRHLKKYITGKKF